MLLDVATFRRRARFELSDLVTDLQSETHRRGSAEALAWRASLPALADVLADSRLSGLHVHVGGPAGLIVEYQLPSAPHWADIVLLGRGAERPAAVVVELKDWRTAGDAPGPTEGLIMHAAREVSHPSDQARGYVEYCRRFHSAVQDAGAEVHGCAFFTFAGDISAYCSGPHSSLVANYPVFARNELDLSARFPEYLASRLRAPDEAFARDFSQGVYKQDRGFVTQVAGAIRAKDSSPFVLLGAQREGYEKCMKHINRVLKPAKATPAGTARRAALGKSVVVIEGPPGSGKSVVAAHLWATIAADPGIDGNVVLTTTSGSQRSNWEALFSAAARDPAAGGLVIGANRYNPGLTPGWVKAEREAGHPTTIAGWRTCLARHATQHGTSRAPADHFAVSIVDEAHALIDPTVPGKEGVSPSGWAMHAGPQAWHVIRCSRVSIFLLDGEQSYRDNETTTLANIRTHAAEFGVDDVEVISLAGSQYRCGGSIEYTQWLDSALDVHRHPAPPTSWNAARGGPFTFTIVSDPFALDEALRDAHSRQRSVRLLASYARRWSTKDAAAPHSVPDSMKDFHITVPSAKTGSSPRTWSRIWNYAPQQDYTLFVQAPSGSAMAADPLSEVGCPYVVRGFDFDYIGLLWLSDLVWRKNRWVADSAHIHETAWRKTRAQARREGSRGPHNEELLHRVQRGYRILLTRALLGAFVWFEDDETREHVQGLLKG